MTLDYLKFILLSAHVVWVGLTPYQVGVVG